MHVLNFGEILKGKKVVDRHPHDSSTTFQVGDRVWLLQGSIKTTRPCCKLDYQRFGPYMISGKINDVTFRLDFPPHMLFTRSSMFHFWSHTQPALFRVILHLPHLQSKFPMALNMKLLPFSTSSSFATSYIICLTG